MADQYAAYDVCRLTMEGSNNSTTFTDDKSHTFTANGAAKLTTSMARLNVNATSCFVGDGTTGCNVSSATSADWNFGSGDFCVDGWFYIKSFTNPNIAFYVADPANIINVSLYFAFDATTGAPTVYLTTDVSTYTITSSTSYNKPLLNRWHHWAVVRSGNTLSLYKDGFLVGSTTVSGTQVFSSYGVVIGGNQPNAGYGFNGYIDDFRMTKGNARYTTPFCPPVTSTFDTISPYITTTSLGTYTKQVSTGATTDPNFDSIISSVDQAIVDLGWARWDSFYQGGQVIKVYRSLNKDAISYKYAMVIWDKTIQQFCLTTCESWDTTTHTATNEVANAVRSSRFGFMNRNTDIIIFGHPRYLGFVTYILNSTSPVFFVTEIEREAAEDTAAAGIPCWGLTSPSLLGINGASSGASQNQIWVPRTKDGRTGQNTSWYQTMIISIAAHGYFGSTSKYSDAYNSTNNWGSFVHGWDTSKRVVTSFKLVENNNSTAFTLRGRLFGIKAGPHSIGNQMDRVTIPCDTDGFYSAAGSATDHWVLDCQHWGFPQQITTTGSYLPTTSSWNTGQNIQAMCFSGQFVYHGTAASGICKTDLTTGTTTTALGGSSGSIHEIAYDGRYVYGASSTGIARIDTLNSDTLASLTIGSGGTAALCWDGWNRVYVSSRNTSNTPVVYAVDTGTFTQVGADITSPSRTSPSTIRGFCCDGIDTVVGAFNSATAADNSILRVTMSTGSSAFTNSANAYASAGVYGVNWDGNGFRHIFAVTGTGNGVHYSNQYTAGGTLLDNNGSITDTFTILTNQYRTWSWRGPRDITIELIPQSAGSSILRSYSGSTSGRMLDYANNNWTGYTAVGGMTTYPRTGYFTGNQILISDNSNVLFHIQNLYRGAYNTTKYCQFLIPR